MDAFVTPKDQFCTSIGAEDQEKCIADIKDDIKFLPTEKGADYCYLTYFWDDQYELLYACLIA